MLKKINFIKRRRQDRSPFEGIDNDAFEEFLSEDPDITIRITIKPSMNSEERRICLWQE